MKAIITFPVLLVAMVTFAGPVMGKGITVELSITGPGLSVPFHTRDSEVIDVSVWGGNFADWESGAVGEPDVDLDRYLVHFWVQVPRSTVQMKYVLWYVWDPNAQRAIVYLPGRRDPWYRTNVYSILREDRDGRWFFATAPWGTAMKRVLFSHALG